MGILRITNTSTPARPVTIVLDAQKGTNEALGDGNWIIGQEDAQAIVTAWADSPVMPIDGMPGDTVRAAEWLSFGEVFVTALYDSGEINIEHWYVGTDGCWLSDAPFDLEVEEL